MFAQAKLNLTLSVLGKRQDGYHVLFSLVTFADFGDELTFKEGGTAFTLEIEGESENNLSSSDNLILKAANLLKGQVPFGHFKLIKRIPIAAGLGGGSADAACALRLLTQDVALQRETAKNIGADVSVCLESRPRFMGGIGHDLSPPVTLPPFYALFVNPRVALSTKDVFATLNAKPFVETAPQPQPTDLMAYIKTTPNALEPAAIALLPLLKPLLEQLNALEGAWLARLSGSGATCFALFDTRDAAKAAERHMRCAHPSFFVKAVTLHA